MPTGHCEIEDMDVYYFHNLRVHLFFAIYNLIKDKKNILKSKPFLILNLFGLLTINHYLISFQNFTRFSRKSQKSKEKKKKDSYQFKKNRKKEKKKKIMLEFQIWKSMKWRFNRLLKLPWIRMRKNAKMQSNVNKMMNKRSKLKSLMKFKMKSQIMK